MNNSRPDCDKCGVAFDLYDADNSYCVECVKDDPVYAIIIERNRYKAERDALIERNRYKAERDALMELINGIPCLCHEGFKSRKLTDPSCPRCNYIEEDIINKIKEG